MSNENASGIMNVETLQMKLENQQNIIKQLTNENEELYQQFNHLMIRNNKLLKRIDDLQGIIDDLHIRIEELQLINGNILKINDTIRTRKENSFIESDNLSEQKDSSEKINNELKRRLEINKVFSHWKKYPGQDARNEPNLRKQALMLIVLHRHKAMRAADLFTTSGVGGVTGARYVATLKKFRLIEYTGARKKGQYVMTPQGTEFVEKAMTEPLHVESKDEASTPSKIFGHLNFPTVEQPGIPVKPAVVNILTSHVDQPDF